MATRKTYKANTNVSINVVLPSKKNLHISFMPLSNGSSVFTTDNEELQKAIESHYRFGSLFRLVGESNIPVKKETSKREKNDKKTSTEIDATTAEESNEKDAESAIEANTTTAEESGGSESDDENENGNLIKVHVTDLASAKDYLADKFGISRTSLRSTKAILEQAASHGCEFEGIKSISI